MRTKLLFSFLFISLLVGAQTTHQLGWGNTGSDANQELTIEVGDTVEWTWGTGTHNLIATSGTETFDSGYHGGPGYVFSYTFNQVGATNYVCSPHAGNMYGTITVAEAQESQEYLVNPAINTATGQYSTTPDTGVDGAGNFPANLGGWGNGGGGAYASSSGVNGDCHSADRMFKFFKVGGAGGQFVNQTVTLPAGTYDWSFWTKWVVLVNWDNDGDVTPKFLIKTDDDGDGTWDNVQTTITAQPTAVDTWVQQTGTYVNDVERQVRIQFFKFGGTAVSPSNLNQLMFIDDVSLKSASSLGLEDVLETQFSFFPNPVNNILTIKAQASVDSITVYNMLGQAMIRSTPNTNDITLDMSVLQTCAYFVQVSINNMVKTVRVIKN